jgi:general secretion pathway protein E
MGEPEAKGIFEDAGNELSKEPAAGFDFNAVKGEISGDFPAFVRQNFRSIYLKKNLVFPLKLKSGDFIILSTHLTKSDTIRDVALKSGADYNSLRIFKLSDNDLIGIINSYYEVSLKAGRGEGDLKGGNGEGEGGGGAEDWAGGFEAEENFDDLKSIDIIDVNSDAPAIKLINTFILEAVKENASDIHIEPYYDRITVRFRIDGSLVDKIALKPGVLPVLVSRIKVMSNLDIAEKRLPQDGRIELTVKNRPVDIRVSVIPTIFGERTVLRILDKSLKLFDINEVGISGAYMDSVYNSLKKTHGMVVSTGPTGSGKTTTLYSFINTVKKLYPDKNIMTVEDPVEYQIGGIAQISINPKIGLTFASGLRHILRQDPDIIMIGEIRDFETAEIAVQSALTGHLVFSTLHTNDAASAFTRLTDMGIEPFLLSSSVLIVFAQRLLRLLCPACKSPIEELRGDAANYYSKVLGDEFGLSPEDLKDGRIYEAKGCGLCAGTGYKGRTAVYEILELNDEIRGSIMSKSPSSEIKAAACRNGMTTLRREAFKKFALGLTSLQEIIRVTQKD